MDEHKQIKNNSAENLNGGKFKKEKAMEELKEGDTVQLMVAGIMIFGEITFKEGKKYFNIKNKGVKIFYEYVRTDFFFVGKETGAIFPK